MAQEQGPSYLHVSVGMEVINVYMVENIGFFY